MIRGALLAVLAGVAPMQATALSCLRPDAIMAYAAARDSDSSYVVLLGTFEFDASRMPRGDLGYAPPQFDTIPATFVGHSLTSRGFDGVVDRSVAIQPVCLGPWCGGLQPGGPILAFARLAGEALVIDADPCAFWVYPQPDRATLDAVLACHTQGRCDPR